MRSWPALSEPRLSRGHFAEPHLAEVRASPESRAAYDALVVDQPMPEGATLAMLHRDARTSIAGPIFVMQKQSGTWTYFVLSAEGEVTAQGALDLCERCHALAPTDHLFGPGAGSAHDAGR